METNNFKIKSEMCNGVLLLLYNLIPATSLDWAENKAKMLILFLHSDEKFGQWVVVIYKYLCYNTNILFFAINKYFLELSPYLDPV